MTSEALERRLRITHTITDALGVEDSRSSDEHAAHGKQLRSEVPFSEQGIWSPPEDRQDPIALLVEQEAKRVQGFIPLRHKRMAASPFAFYRGAALIMASDLSQTPVTDIEVQVCGDAHISNFGFFKSPEGRMIFDINDFDETARGPWEWDLKRLVTSIEICGQDRGFSKKERKQAIMVCVQTYRKAMAEFAEMGHLDMWHDHIDANDVLDSLSEILSKKEIKRIRKAISKMQKKDNYKAVTKLTETVDGQRRFISNPPLVIPLREVTSSQNTNDALNADKAERIIKAALMEYRHTVSPDVHRLLKLYRGVDAAHKVVGVGSVGLRSFIVLLEGANRSDSLVLQIKEAVGSVVDRYYGKERHIRNGRRVVLGQCALQSFSDIMLGWCHLPNENGTISDYYVRQLWNGKGSIDPETIEMKSFLPLCAVCGWTLAHGHARTGNRFKIAGYLGKNDGFDKAMVHFARAYARQNQEDYDRFMKALTHGELD